MTFNNMSTDPFVVHRGLLFTVAYELLGSAADAEDVLQESWLRWSRTCPRSTPTHRSQVSWRTSSASAAEPSIS